MHFPLPSPASRARGACPPFLVLAALCGAADSPAPAHADEVSVAVAANFTAPLTEIATAFTAATGHVLLVSGGSTGALAAQVANGAPFEVLLAADDATPARLEAEGLAVPGTRRTYAIGRLALWSSRESYVDPAGAVLREGGFRHLAIANPQVAPYGAAAVAALEALGLRETLVTLFVQGENIGQAYQFVASGAAELGFVALSQVWRDGRFTSGSGWLVPAALHPPLRQEAVLLTPGRDKPGALALLEYLGQPAARAVIASYGYDSPSTVPGSDAVGR
jgi:molybdate transport system substrate-binding protein